MLNRTLKNTSLLFAFGILGAQAVSAAPSFPDMSGTLRQVEDGEKKTAKIFISGSKLRLNHVKGDLIIDLAKNRMTILMPAQKAYMEGSFEKQAAPLLVRLQDPCEEAKKNDLDCKKAGSATVGGRKADKWELRSKGGNDLVETRYIDQEAHIPLKIDRGSEGVEELTDLRLAKQPESLFSVPAGYRALNAKK